MNKNIIQNPNAPQALPPQLLRLFVSTQNGDKNSVQQLLSAGVPVNFIDPASTDSPLMLACRFGHADIVRLCLDYGAKNDPHPDYGQTALHAAVASSQVECADVLLCVAAESEADALISNLTDQNGQTPLHTAVVVGSVELVDLLVRHGASISALDAFGQTPVHLCAGTAHAHCLAVVLGHGGDEVIDLPDIYGNTPLHHAAYHGRLDCVKLLLETAADVTVRNAKNLTAYNLASTQGHHTVGLLLLDYRDQHFASTPIKRGRFSPEGLSTPLSNSSSKNKQRFSYHSVNNSSLSIYATPQTSDRGRHRPEFDDGDDGEEQGVAEVLIPIKPPKGSAQNNNISNKTNGTGSRRGMQLQQASNQGLDLPRPHNLGSPLPSSARNSNTSNHFKQNASSSANSSPRYLSQQLAPGVALEEVHVAVQASPHLQRRNSPLRPTATQRASSDPSTLAWASSSSSTHLHSNNHDNTATAFVGNVGR